MSSLSFSIEQPEKHKIAASNMVIYFIDYKFDYTTKFYCFYFYIDALKHQL